MSGILTTFLTTFLAATPAPVEQLSDLFIGENALDVSIVFDQIYGLLPFVLPAVLGFIGFRKGLSWLMGQIQGA